MAETAISIDDLEDGEIESDGEEYTENQIDLNETKEVESRTLEDKPQEEEQEVKDVYYSKSGKKKKSKSNKGEHKSKDRSKKNRKYADDSPIEDDFAGNIEKAIRKAMNKNEAGESYDGDGDDRRKYKKRKKYDNKDGSSNKKRKKHEYQDDMDEIEMMCVRGASPVHKQSPVPDNMYAEDDRDSYASDSSNDSRGHHRLQKQRPQQRDRNKNNKNDRRRGAHAHPMQDPDGVCLYYMQGKCHKGDDCIYSHAAQPPRKMELCKFYLMDCCAKRDKCLYMHSDFPCKYYHTGLPCIYKDECKFAHGTPLTENLKNILLKHIESAPKEILGDFPRLNREGAIKMIQNTQAKLIQQHQEFSENVDKNIPSLFEINIPSPQIAPDNLQMNNFNMERNNKISPKVRHSRWQNDSNNMQNYNLSPGGKSGSPNVLNIKNLTGVLTPRQISDLSKMGIENLDQLGQLTVLQLNSIGISLKQITEIQLNTMSIQKFGLINYNTEQQPQQFVTNTAGTKDLDLRVPPAVSLANSAPLKSELPGQDVDMRFHPSVSVPASDDNVYSNKTMKIECQPNKDMIDIDQYTKDALKFASKDKENIDISNESYESEKGLLANQIKDVDHRVLPFTEEDHKTPSVIDPDHVKKGDTDIRFLQPGPLFKSPEKRLRRSTTDDEDNNLLIDEKWYSSDEEKSNKKKSPCASPRPTLLSPQYQPAPHVIEPSSVLSRLGDLSKIDISEEVTKLLNTMKNNLQDNKVDNNTDTAEVSKSRDPRKRSPDKEKLQEVNKPLISSAKKPRVSIYECIDGEPTDGRRRTDVDLRNPEYPAFGDTDLRQGTSGDIDFRLGLPFKAIPNYTPASEINGSINSHPPIPFKLVPIHIPRPDYTDIRNSTAKSQALVDPRLRKVFRLSVEESNSDSEKSIKVAVPATPRVDPRRKIKEAAESSNQDQKSNLLDIQTILQNSTWFKELSSTQKIFVNQNLMPVTQMIKQYQQEKVPGMTFDLGPIQTNPSLVGIFTNLGVTLGENGEYSYVPKHKEGLLKTPSNFNHITNAFGMNASMANPGGIDASNMGMMSMPPMRMPGVGMNNMNVGHIQGFNQPLSDPRGGPQPGLLGIAPNIPHNFNNFGSPHFGNMSFSGPNPGNDFNFMDGDNYQRFPNRGGHRGRGNDRWNRGGSSRGNRDRKNFSDRGNWKNDRH